MGSAALPRILAGLIALFALMVLVRAWRGRSEATPTDETAPATAALSGLGVQPLRAFAAFVVLVAYVAALDFGRAPFIPATAVFVVALGVTLTKPSWRGALGFALFGAALAVGVDVVFTRFLYVDLG